MCLYARILLDPPCSGLGQRPRLNLETELDKGNPLAQMHGCPCLLCTSLCLSAPRPLCTSVHLSAPLRTSVHLSVPLCTPPHLCVCLDLFCVTRGRGTVVSICLSEFWPLRLFFFAFSASQLPPFSVCHLGISSSPVSQLLFSCLLFLPV